MAHLVAHSYLLTFSMGKHKKVSTSNELYFVLQHCTVTPYIRMYLSVNHLPPLKFTMNSVVTITYITIFLC